jgi:uncharacterized protein YaeQ
MAQSASIFKVEIQVSDMNRHYYGAHNLTIARHPSETDTRMMLRILAFGLNAGERLSFTRGISTDDEPDLWEKDYTGEIELWIDLGTPEDKRIRKACGLARKVIVYAYNERSANLWWDKYQNQLQRHANLAVCLFDDRTRDAIGDLVSKSMQLQVTIQDNDVFLGDTTNTVAFSPATLKQSVN